MEVNDTKKVVDMINGELKETIQKGIYNHFGVNTNIHAIDCGRGNIQITDSMHDVKDKMTGNKFLRRFISDASLVGYAWMEEKSNIIYIRVHVCYNHTTGGSNGKELGKMLVYTNTKRTKYLPY